MNKETVYYYYDKIDRQWYIEDAMGFYLACAFSVSECRDYAKHYGFRLKKKGNN